MKPKAGIFDPWRQAPPPAPQVVTKTADTDETLGAGTTPVRFAGKRAGLVVWLPESDDVAAQAKTNVLVALETLMKDTDLFRVFMTRGISDRALNQEFTRISDGSRAVYVTGDYIAGIDAIALAFREASRMKGSVEQYLKDLGIRPYIR